MDAVSLKRHAYTDYNLCIFCHANVKHDLPHQASEKGLTTVKHATNSRKKLRDLQNAEAIDRLETFFESKLTATLVWHRQCYAEFTNKCKIDRIRTRLDRQCAEERAVYSGSGEMLSGGHRPLRKNVEPVNWNLCLFCQIEKPKKRLSSVMTKKMSNQIIEAAHLDYKVSVRLAGVIDLIAAEAKYHLDCLSSFTRSTNKTRQISAKSDIAMAWLCNELEQAAEYGKILHLDVVWERYLKLSAELSINIPQSFQSRRTTFKEKLQTQLGDSFLFYQPLDKCQSERKTVLIPVKHIGVVLNLDETQDEASVLPPYAPEDDNFLSLVHIALMIRGDIMATPAHEGISVGKDEAVS